MLSSNLFDALKWHVNGKPNTKGEVYITCPNCRKKIILEEW